MPNEIEILEQRIENLREALKAIADTKDIAFCIKYEMTPFPRRYKNRIQMIAQVTLSEDNLNLN